MSVIEFYLTAVKRLEDSDRNFIVIVLIKSFLEFCKIDLMKLRLGK